MRGLISICVTCKNRSKVVFNDDVIIRPFPSCVDSIIKSYKEVKDEMYDTIELVVTECNIYRKYENGMTTSLSNRG